MLKRALEQQGHTVYVVTVSNNALKHEYDEKERILKVAGIPIGIYDYRLSSIYPVTLINKMKKWDLDIIHSHTEFGVGILARLFAKQFNIPLVHTYHTLYEDYTHYITHGYFEKSSKKIVEYLTKFYCDKTANELIVPTNKIYSLFKEKYNFTKNIHIIPTGIEVDRFYEENINKKEVESLKKKLGLKKNNFTILFVGRLAEEKNVEFLINAHKKLVEYDNDIKLLIVGDGPDKEKYEQLSKSLGLEENIIFNGKAAWEEIPVYYHACNVFSTASTTETQGLTVIEAMAAGVPPLCIDDDSFKGTVTDGLNGKIFKNEEQYISEVKELYEDKKELSIYSKQARVQAEHCSSRAYASSVIEVYNRALKEKKEKQGLFKKIINFFKGE